MKFIDNIKERVRKNLKTIVLPETSDIRTIEAARKITDEGFANIILVGEKDAIYSLAKDNNIYISDIKVIDPKNYEKTEFCNYWRSICILLLRLYSDTDRSKTTCPEKSGILG